MTTDEIYGSKELERDYGPLTFGRALWSHRKCEELSQKEFAMSIGISAQSLCDIEKGRKIPSPKRAAKIARHIGQPEKIWIELALQDMLRQEDLDYTVSVA
ncbi:MAG: helix-turn-helix transcriptional regulator [Deltaproteobacteria bacterium]|nr:helix-turn-helix transcriptional regulator [Deltaproteobacteria bacterium]MBW2010632.1 helix-turn-helix transcriptional regulator [Deltaproteobacteria bacterium]MBW2099476.1 helix-turn-helix transcriptional regulator [Deltaproteobacteria bacterium]